jgi:CHAT domain-containing protein
VALRDVLPQLGRLTKPIADHLRGMRAGAVTLVPTGGLGLVPLHAGVYPGPGGRQSLLDDFDVAYAPSARAAIPAHAVTSAGSGKRHLVAVSNPTDDLPYASLEVDLIQSRFPSHTVLPVDEATIAKVIDAVRGSSHVHFACHGRYDPNEPLSSSLALADGPLTLREVIDAGSFAGVGLVVASACQSAVTEFNRIPDEAIGFPAGFLQAGAAGIVATLWSVPDLSSSLIMSRFYELLSKAPSRNDRDDPPVDPATALVAAQRWLRDLTAGRLLDYASRYPALMEALDPALKFARAHPNARPFGRPSHWAPYLYVGT